MSTAIEQSHTLKLVPKHTTNHLPQHRVRLPNTRAA
uniref:Uncharacterized protein n=1 Tax=Zea mays TaxID=4577 RepID=B4FH01_MAIZE|nr:unknown [Zea mays]